MSDKLDKIHHIISNFTLLLIILEYYDNLLIELFYYAELSNIFIFLNYHIIKTVENRHFLLLSYFFELIIYTYCRVYKFTYIFIFYFDTIIYSPLIILVLIYFMSIDWAYTLFNNFIQLCKIYYHT